MPIRVTTIISSLARCGDLVRRLPQRARLVALLVVLAEEAALVWRIGSHTELAAYLVFGVVGWMVSLFDLTERRVPNVVVLPAYPVLLGLLLVAAAADGQWDRLLRGVLALAVLVGCFGGLALLAPRGLGFGDVKLAGLVGLCCGYLGWSAVLLAVVLSFGLGALLVALLVGIRRANRGTHIPFAPLMVAGAIVAILLR